MKTKRTVTITQEHIDKGVRGNCRRCPGKLAVDATFPELGDTAILGPLFIYYDVGSDKRVAPGPMALRAFIRNLDLSLSTPVPVAFELELDLT